MTMAWAGLEGHDAIAERFRRSLERGRFASSYLFVGPPAVGKRAFALRLAQALLCERRTEARFDPCQQCSACLQVMSGSHPDVECVGLLEGKSGLLIEQFVGDREHRSQEGFCHRMALRPASGRRRVGIIDDADHLSPESANCLLKFLEEPPPRLVLILIGTSLQRQLPTIRSRCQTVHFQGLPDWFVSRHLVQAGICQHIDEADRVAKLAEGSLDRAIQFADPELRQFSEEVASQWRQAFPDTLAIAKRTQAYVDAAGREATVRRDRLRKVLQGMIRQLRQEITRLIDRPERTSSPHGRSPLDVADRRLDCCLVTLQQLEANANLPTLIECWSDQLGQAAWRAAGPSEAPTSIRRSHGTRHAPRVVD